MSCIKMPVPGMEDLDSESFLNGEDWKDQITVELWMLLL